MVTVDSESVVEPGYKTLVLLSSQHQWYHSEQYRTHFCTFRCLHPQFVQVSVDEKWSPTVMLTPPSLAGRVQICSDEGKMSFVAVWLTGAAKKPDLQ